MTNNDEIIIWNDKYLCGLTLIDEQHKKLVELINGFFTHVTGNDEQEHNYFNGIIKEALDYLRLHFAAEEKIMFVTEFEGYNRHKREHEKIISAVLKNIREYEAGKRLTLYAFTRFLKEWLISHVLLDDKLYFEHLRNLKAIRNHTNVY